VSTRRIIGCVAAAIAIVVVGWEVFREGEPVYEGRTLSGWLELLARTDDARAQGRIVEVALGKIGTNGLGWMVEWLSYEEPRWRRPLSEFVGRLPGQLVPNVIISGLEFDRKRQRADDAATMLYAVGPAATNAIPKLQRLMDDPKAGDASRRAISALASLGKDGLPPLLAALSDPRHSNRVEIIHAISELETNAGPAVPVLVECLQEQDAEVFRAAADVLGYLKLEPEIVVPALAGGLTSQDYESRIRSAEDLMEFEGAAKPAVPSLLQALDDRDAWVRNAAEYALERIAPEELAKDKRTKTHEPPMVFHRID